MMEKLAFHSHSTKELTLEDDLKLARETGYDGTITSYDKFTAYLESNSQKDLKQLVRDSKTAVCGISNIPVNLFVPDRDVFTILKRCARLVRSMKGNFISITPEKDTTAHSNRDKLVDIYIENCNEMSEYVSEYDVNLVIEPFYSDPILMNLVDLSFIVRSSRKNVGYALDTFTLKKEGRPLEEIETIQNDFFVVYLSDAPDKRTLREKDRELLGNGDLDFELVLKAIKKCSFNGIAAVKLFSAYRTKKRNKTLLKNARIRLCNHLAMYEFI